MGGKQTVSAKLIQFNFIIFYNFFFFSTFRKIPEIREKFHGPGPSCGFLNFLFIF